MLFKTDQTCKCVGGAAVFTATAQLVTGGTVSQLSRQSCLLELIIPAGETPGHWSVCGSGLGLFGFLGLVWFW